MSEPTGIDVVAAFMRAFREQDRTAAESLMAGDFVFTSPQDDHIDMNAWLERGFPSANHFDDGATTLQIVEVDGVVLHRYEYRLAGVWWRNVAATHVVSARVRNVEVYFGGAVNRAP